jgi:hypothetical protein
MTQKKTSKLFPSLVYWAIFFIGCACGLLLANISELKVYKVLNLIGLIWNILGLITMSYLLSKDDNFQLHALRISSFLMSIILVQLPLESCLDQFLPSYLTFHPHMQAI